MKKCLNKILSSEKWKEMKRMFLLLLPKAIEHGTFQGPQSLEPSIGHQERWFPIDLQTLDSFQGPPNMEHSKGPPNMEHSKGHQA